MDLEGETTGAATLNINEVNVVQNNVTAVVNADGPTYGLGGFTVTAGVAPITARTHLYVKILKRSRFVNAATVDHETGAFPTATGGVWCGFTEGLKDLSNPDDVFEQIHPPASVVERFMSTKIVTETRLLRRRSVESKTIRELDAELLRVSGLTQRELG